jgi:hypothetical protein
MLCEIACVDRVALRPGLRLRLLDDELGNMWLEDLVEPCAPLALLEADMQLPGNLCEMADERLAVGLDNILSDPLAGRAHHVDRRALRMGIDSEIALHRGPPWSGLRARVS